MPTCFQPGLVTVDSWCSVCLVYLFSFLLTPPPHLLPCFSRLRYGSHPAFAALEPINEPRADTVSFADLAAYYNKCYELLRRHSPTAYFIISGRIFASEREWDQFMTGE